MVDKLAHSVSAAHMSAVKAMGFADWFPESVRKPQIVQEVQSLDMFMWNGVCVRAWWIGLLSDQPVLTFCKYICIWV